MTTIEWKDGWPILNENKPILLSESFGTTPDQKYPPAAFRDTFRSNVIDSSWYQLRTPYTKNYRTGTHGDGGITFTPNVFSLSERDTPAAILRKQKSLNMTFSASLLPTTKPLGYLQSIGISAYLSEFQHQDIGVRGCFNQTGMCFYSTLLMNGTSTVRNQPFYLIIENADHGIQTSQIPLNSTVIPTGITLTIRATPLKYSLGFQFGTNPVVWMADIASSWLAFAPKDFFVFEGASFALFASGNGNPWPFDAPSVGFKEVNEVYFDENIPDYDIWN